MPTQQNTNTSNQYNPGALNSYNAFQPQLASSYMQMASNPFGSSYFQNQLAQLKAGAQQTTQRNQSNVLQNMRTGGGILSNSAGFTTAALNRNNIGGSIQQSNAFNSAVNGALQNRNSALMGMAAYQPLQTGQNSTQSSSGLGTWLPQVAGAAFSALSPGLGSMMGGNSFSSGYQPQAARANGGGAGFGPPPTTGQMQNPFGTGGSMNQYPISSLPY